MNVIEKKNVIHRLKIIKGHLRLVTSMVERGDKNQQTLITSFINHYA